MAKPEITLPAAGYYFWESPGGLIHGIVKMDPFGVGQGLIFVVQSKPYHSLEQHQLLEYSLSDQASI